MIREHDEDVSGCDTNEDTSSRFRQPNELEVSNETFDHATNRHDNRHKE